MFGLQGGAPVHAGRHDVRPGDYATAEHQQGNVQIEVVVHTPVPFLPHYLFHLQHKSPQLCRENPSLTCDNSWLMLLYVYT